MVTYLGGIGLSSTSKEDPETAAEEAAQRNREAQAKHRAKAKTVGRSGPMASLQWQVSLLGAPLANTAKSR